MALGGDPLLHMCWYHLGLEEVDGDPSQAAAGKMLRPALCLAMCEALGGDEDACRPGALAVELAHCTSLVFDDIQDNSPQRNGRAAAWIVWGAAQALNAGLALSSYSRLALQGMAGRVDPATVLLVQRLMEEAVINLCRGQYLDLHFQETLPSLADYWAMVRLKTGVLMGVGCQVGALIAGEKVRQARRFGEALVVAFQLQDDYLGVWGQAEALGGVVYDCLPAALAVALVHRMSLVCDDIQEHSPQRNGRTSVWHMWGADQALNVGLALSCIAGWPFRGCPV